MRPKWQRQLSRVSFLIPFVLLFCGENNCTDRYIRAWVGVRCNCRRARKPYKSIKKCAQIKFMRIPSNDSMRIRNDELRGLEVCSFLVHLLIVISTACLPLLRLLESINSGLRHSCECESSQTAFVAHSTHSTWFGLARCSGAMWWKLLAQQSTMMIIMNWGIYGISLSLAGCAHIWCARVCCRCFLSVSIAHSIYRLSGCVRPFLGSVGMLLIGASAMPKMNNETMFNGNRNG